MKKIFFLLLFFTFSVMPMNNDNVISLDEEDIDNTHTQTPILNIIQPPPTPQELGTGTCLFFCGMAGLGAALVFTKYSIIFYNALTNSLEK